MKVVIEIPDEDIINAAKPYLPDGHPAELIEMVLQKSQDNLDDMGATLKEAISLIIPHLGKLIAARVIYSDDSDEAEHALEEYMDAVRDLVR